MRVFSNRDSLIESSIRFTENSALIGGGVYLALTSESQIIKVGNDYIRTKYNLHFTQNSVRYGGAVYIADETNYKLCASTFNYNEHNSDSTECSLQIITLFETLSLNYNILSL